MQAAQNRGGARPFHINDIIIDYPKIKIIRKSIVFEPGGLAYVFWWCFVTVSVQTKWITYNRQLVTSFLDSNVRVAIVENTELALRCPSNTLIITVTTQLTPVEEY